MLFCLPTKLALYDVRINGKSKKKTKIKNVLPLGGIKWKNKSTTSSQEREHRGKEKSLYFSTFNSSFPHAAN